MLTFLGQVIHEKTWSKNLGTLSLQNIVCGLCPSQRASAPVPEKVENNCAAKAFYSCPAIISQRLESRIISKEPQENTEEESKII